RLIDVYEQRIHLGLVRQLLEQGTEGFLDLLLLLHVELEIDGLRLLRRELVAQLLFLVPGLLERLQLVAPEEEVTSGHDHGKQQEQAPDLDRPGPAPRIAETEAPQIVECHAFLSPTEAVFAGAWPGGACSADLIWRFMLNSLTRMPPTLTALTSTTFGS